MFDWLMNFIDGVPTCDICGRKATIRIVGKGKAQSFCGRHYYKRDKNK